MRAVLLARDYLEAHRLALPLIAKVYLMSVVTQHYSSQAGMIFIVLKTSVLDLKSAWL